MAMDRNVYGVRHNVVSVLVSEIDPELRQYPQSECIKDHFRRHPSTRQSQKLKPWRSITGTARNIGRLGSTNQNVDSSSKAILCASPVSRHSQMAARTEMIGREAISPPTAGLYR